MSTYLRRLSSQGREHIPRTVYMANKANAFQQLLDSSNVPQEWLEEQLRQYTHSKNIDLETASLEDLREVLSSFLQDSILEIQNIYS